MSKVHDLLAREPVLLGGAVLATVAIADPSPVVLGAVTAWVTLGQRLLSTPTKRAEQRARETAATAAHGAHVEGYQAGVNELAELARAQRRARR